MATTKPYPFPGTYAVAEIDLEASLADVNDPEIRAAAQEIRPAKCLIMLNMVRLHSQ